MIGPPEVRALADPFPTNPLEGPFHRLVEWGHDAVPQFLPYVTDPTDLGVGAAALVGTVVAGAAGLRCGARGVGALGRKLDRRPGVIALARRTEGGSLARAANPHFLLSFEERCMHSQVVAPTRQGKTSLLLPWIDQDLAHGHTVIVIQTGGDLGTRSLELADARAMPVNYLNPADPATMKWNPLVGTGSTPADLAEQATATLEAISASNNVFYEKTNTVILRKMVLAAHAYARAKGLRPNLAVIWRWLESDRRLMKDLQANSEPGGRFSVGLETLDSGTRGWLANQYLQWAPKDRIEKTMALYNVLDDMLGRDVVEHVLTPGPEDETVDVASASARGGLILCDVPAPDVGEVPSMTLATWFLMRVMQDLERRKVNHPVCLYLDEMQLILGRANSRAAQRFERWITGIGKYGVAVHVAYQGFSQLSDPLHDILESNATHKFFSGRLGPKDARIAQRILGEEEREVESVMRHQGARGGSVSVGSRTVLRPRKTIDEITKLPRGDWYVRTAHDGNLQDPIVVESLPLPRPAAVTPPTAPAPPKKPAEPRAKPRAGGSSR